MFFKKLKDGKKIQERDWVSRVYLINGGSEKTRKSKVAQLLKDDTILLQGSYTHNNETAIVFAYNTWVFKGMTFEKAKSLAGKARLDSKLSIDTTKQNNEPKFGTVTLPPDYNPWKENSETAYQNYLKYAGIKVNADIESNHAFSLFSPNNSESVCAVFSGDFSPLMDTPLPESFFCSKITFKNVENAEFIFRFKNNFDPRSVGIEAISDNLHIACRNIVPSIFSHVPELAGNMGFHECILDGNNSKNGSSILVEADANFSKTPIKIVFENCKGTCEITGLNSEGIERIFEKTSDDNDLIFREESQFNLMKLE